MKIEIDEKSGFCFGVVNAIAEAERSLEGGEVYSLGDIVHNGIEVMRLENLGLKTIDRKELESLRNRTVLIRAHGEPPSTYAVARKNRVTLIDATCQVVAKLQKKVVEAHRRMRQCGGQVVILGKKGHAEVIGLTGQVDSPTLVIENLDDLENIDFTRPIYLLSQTTQSLELFEAVGKEILARSADPETVVIDDTICRQVSNRNPHLSEFAKKYDIVIFVSGRKSSNGKVLFSTCLAANSNSRFIEDETELRKEWFEGCRSVGVCGATSTPKWLMQRVADSIRAEYC